MINYEAYITRNLKKENFTEEQIRIVIDLVIGLLPKEKDDSLSLIKYANRKFEERYGNQQIFCFFPVSPQIMKYINDFKLTNKLNGEKYRKFIEWLMLEGEKHLGRIPSVKDLTLSRIFCIFEKEKDSPKVEEKKKAKSKNLLIVT